jgi:hypothetical protein
MGDASLGITTDTICFPGLEDKFKVPDLEPARSKITTRISEIFLI